MMDALREIRAALALNLLSLRHRLGSGAVVVLSTASVVAVLVSIMAMAAGISATVSSTGRADRVVILSGGVDREADSAISRNNYPRIEDAPGLARIADGTVLASPEKLLSIRAVKKSTGLETSLSLRGVGKNERLVRPELRLVKGRWFQAGRREVVVGQAALSRFRGVQIGNNVTLRGAPWRIVGVFTGGSLHDSELLTDVDTLQSALHSVIYNSVTATLRSKTALAQLRRYLADDPSLSVSVVRENDYYARQSADIFNLIELVARVIGAIMSVGALFATLTIMYDAVSKRSSEIGTLRAIGYSPESVATAYVLEAVLLSAVGALLGAFVAWIAFGGATSSAEAGAGQVVFRFHINLAIVAIGVGWAVVVGILGGSLPAMRAARYSVTTVLRGL